MRCFAVFFYVSFDNFSSYLEVFSFFIAPEQRLLPARFLKSEALLTLMVASDLKGGTLRFSEGTVSALVVWMILCSFATLLISQFPLGSLYSTPLQHVDFSHIVKALLSEAF